MDDRIGQLVRQKQQFTDLNQPTLEKNLLELTETKFPSLPIDSLRASNQTTKQSIQICLRENELNSELDLTSILLRTIKEVSLMQSKIEFNSSMPSSLKRINEIEESLEKQFHQQCDIWSIKETNNSLSFVELPDNLNSVDLNTLPVRFQLFIKSIRFVKQTKDSVYDKLALKCSQELSQLTWISDCKRVNNFAIEFLISLIRMDKNRAVELFSKPLKQRFDFHFSFPSSNTSSSMFMLKMSLDDLIQLKTSTFAWIASCFGSEFEKSIFHFYSNLITNEISIQLENAIQQDNWSLFVESIRLVFEFDRKTQLNLSYQLFAKLNCLKLWIDKEVELIFTFDEDLSFISSNYRMLLENLIDLPVDLQKDSFKFFLQLLNDQIGFVIKNENLPIHQTFSLLHLLLNQIISVQFELPSNDERLKELNEFLKENNTFLLLDRQLRIHLLIFKNSYLNNDNLEYFYKDLLNLLLFESLDGTQSHLEKLRIFSLICKRIDEFVSDQIIFQFRWSTGQFQQFIQRFYLFVQEIDEKYKAMKVSFPLINSQMILYRVINEDSSIKQLSKYELFSLLKKKYHFNESFLTDENYRLIKQCIS